MIPQGQYDPKLLQDVVQRLRTEINDVRAARRGLDNHWMKLLKAYRALPEQERKTFPFPNCANLVIPVVGTDVDKTYAWIMAMLFGQPNLWTLKATRADMVDMAPRMQEFLEWAQNHELNAYDEIADWVKELVLLGTAVLKTRYVRDRQKVYEYRETEGFDIFGQPATAFERLTNVMIHDHPAIEHVPLWDMYFHPQATSIKNSPWVAQNVPLTWAEYEQRVRMGVYNDGGKLGESWAHEYSHPIVRMIEQTDKFKPYRGTKLDLCEIWTKEDIVGDGDPVALVITLHMPTGIPVRVDYIPYFSQEPPYDIARFVRQSKRIYGIGLGDMLYLGQQEISTMHNQRIDSTTVRIMPIFAAPKNGSIGVDEPLWAGRIIHEDAPGDFRAIPLATGAWESTANDEQMTLAYHRERTGINDFVMGGDGPDVGYATATTALNQLREGKKRFDQTMREVRAALGGVGVRVLELYQQFSQGQKVFTAMGATDGAIVQKVLTFPLDIIRAGINVDIAATNAAMNKEVEVRTNTLLMQLLQQHNMQTMQLMMQAMNPQLPEPVRQVIMTQIRGSSLLMRRILDSYGVQDADDMTMNFDKMMGGAASGPAPGIGQPAGFGPTGGSGGPLSLPGMAAVQAGAPPMLGSGAPPM